MKKYRVILCFVTFVAGCKADPFGECPPVDGERPIYLSDMIQRNVFWQCDSGKPIRHVCPSGLVHNPNLDVCDYPSITSIPFGPIGKCEIYSKALFRDGYNVGAYWACMDGKPVENWCKHGMWFTANYGGACYDPSQGHPED